MRLLFILSIFSILSADAQSLLKLKSGNFALNESFDLSFTSDDSYRLMQFEELPTQAEQEELQTIGVELLSYPAKNIYLVSFSTSLTQESLSHLGVSGVYPILPEYKIDPKLQGEEYPYWAMSNGQLNLNIVLHQQVDFEQLKGKLARTYAIERAIPAVNRLQLSIDPAELMNLAAEEAIWFIEPIDPPSVPENKTGRTLHRSNAINTNFSAGRQYDGSGVSIMMQDDGYIGPHIDYQGRADQTNCVGCSNSSWDDHGDHVAGIIMGAANLDPVAEGMAKGAKLYVFDSNNGNYNDVPTLYANDAVVITSKSYGNGCNAGYTSLSQDLDAQVNSHKALMHVFSGGNSGTSDCGYGAGSGWGNVTGGHKQGKNVLAVANLDLYGNTSNSSSRGPAADGRIKPDIGAKGSSVYSTIPSYDYDSYSGTSMACPGVAGTLAQLYQAYRELNAGANPHSALMKCVLLNGADDVGNAGPDFTNGWGELNALQSLQMLEDGNYFTDSVSQGNSKQHSIQVPAAAKELKLMVYWHDKEGDPAAAKSLVNDLNISLTDPQGATYNPWVLNHQANAATLDDLAIRSVDSLNNMEQITIDNPIAGTYTFTVNGFAVPFGDQAYWVSYMTASDEITLTYPIGGESLVPGEQEVIRWDAYDNGSNYSLEYTLDGVNWNSIATSISSAVRHYQWTVPNSSTEDLKVKISRNNNSDESDATATITGVPQNINVNWVCPDSIWVSWNAVSNATSYEVSMLGAKYMDSITTTTVNSGVWIINPNPSVTDSWFSVAANYNSGKGRRAMAVNAQAINNGCVAPPIASFSVSDSLSCSGKVHFMDESFNQPNSWSWQFGDGQSSNLQNPTHTYTSEGVYNVSLAVANSLGQDSVYMTTVVEVDFLDAPEVTNDTAYGASASLSLSAVGDNLQWYADTLGSASIASGNAFQTPTISQTTPYYVRSLGGPAVYGGPADNSIGGGGYYNNDRHLFIDCYKPSTLVSTVVYAGSSQALTFELRDNNSNLLQDTTITVQTGANTVYLNFDLPVMNNLELGFDGGGMDLYRNSSGAFYPYPIGDLASITGHNSPNSTYYHYFFYFLELRENCISSYAEALAVMNPSGLEDVLEEQWSISPNPTNGSCFIESAATIKALKLYDAQGRLCWQQDEVNEKQYQLDLADLAQGAYYLELAAEEAISRKKLMLIP